MSLHGESPFFPHLLPASMPYRRSESLTYFILQVIKLISQVIADFANGEISQIGSLFNTQITMQQYLDKSYYKTATLIAAGCKSAAVFSGVTQQMKEQMFEYGRHLGLAFQVVDDILDFTQTAEQLGKPQVKFSCKLLNKFFKT